MKEDNFIISTLDKFKKDSSGIETSIIRQKDYFGEGKFFNEKIEPIKSNILSMSEILKDKSFYLNSFSNIITYNPKFLKPVQSPQPGLAFEVKEQITAENIAEFAYPLAQFAHEVQPDFIIACDRGARMIGLATAMMYSRLYGALPTLDHRVNFRKISGNVPSPALRATIKQAAEKMLAKRENPTVMVLDDWVSSGRTKKLVYELFDEFSEGKIKVLYAIMRGKGADISGSKDSDAIGDWRDRPNIIGVDYDLDGKSIIPEPQKVKSLKALGYRQTMSTSIDNFVEALKASIKTEKQLVPAR